jgi:prephenate dehydratase
MVLVVIMFLSLNNSAFANVGYLAPLGPAGTYAEDAAKKYFGSVRMTPFRTAQDLLNELVTSKVEYALIPVETNTSGFTSYVPLVIDEFRFIVAGEVVIEIGEGSANNATRFWAVTTQNNLSMRGNKATLLAEGDVRNLHRLFAILDREGLEITAVHDYPTKIKLGQYKFLIDVAAKDKKGKANVTSALVRAEQTQKNLFRIRIIGIYDEAKE